MEEASAPRRLVVVLAEGVASIARTRLTQLGCEIAGPVELSRLDQFLVSSQAFGTDDRPLAVILGSDSVSQGVAAGGVPTPLLTSFGFTNGMIPADILFDMRFLKNPYWQAELRDLDGRDQAAADHIASDARYSAAIESIETMLVELLPRIAQSGRPDPVIAFGCTGGRHRSVHVAERIAARLRAAGFSPTVRHRDLASRMG